MAARGLSLAAESRGYSSLWCAGFSLLWLLLLRSTGSRHAGLVAPRDMGSSQTRAWTCVPCIGRRILNHWATREVPQCGYLWKGEKSWDVVAKEWCFYSKLCRTLALLKSCACTTLITVNAKCILPNSKKWFEVPLWPGDHQTCTRIRGQEAWMKRITETLIMVIFFLSEVKVFPPRLRSIANCLFTDNLGFLSPGKTPPES